MTTIERGGKKFDIPRLGRAHLREMRKKGFDLIQKAFRMGKEGEIPITGEELDILLETTFPGREADLDEVGLSAQIEIASTIITEAFGHAQEIKN